MRWEKKGCGQGNESGATEEGWRRRRLWVGQSDGEMELENGWGGEWKSLIADSSQFPWQPQAFPTHSGFFLPPCRHQLLHFGVFLKNFSLFFCRLRTHLARWDPFFLANANP